jgi:hypothetical protein
MILAIVIGLVIGGAGLIARDLIVPAFQHTAHLIDHPGEAR